MFRVAVFSMIVFACTMEANGQIGAFCQIKIGAGGTSISSQSANNEVIVGRNMTYPLQYQIRGGLIGGIKSVIGLTNEDSALLGNASYGTIFPLNFGQVRNFGSPSSIQYPVSTTHNFRTTNFYAAYEANPSPFDPLAGQPFPVSQVTVNVKVRYPGDVNGDNRVLPNDVLVVSQNKNAGTGGGDFTKGDFNLDGVVDQVDLDLVVGNVGDIYPDLDFSGSIGFGDFQILSSNFGIANPTFAEGDFNGDGAIDFDDFLILSSFFD